MTFQSVLFPQIGARGTRAPAAGTIVDAPECFGDLNLDQIIEAITAGKKDYDLKPFFHTPLHDGDIISYRQEVAQDLENEAVLACIRAFAQQMIIVRRYLGMIERLEYQYHKEGWFLETVDVYCAAVSQLAADLAPAPLRSRGLLAFREYLARYAASAAFTTLQAETAAVKRDLAAIRYCVIVKGNTVRVRRYEEEIDYSADVEETFEKFKQGAVKDYTVKLAIGAGMNHVEAQILGLVARLNPEVFAGLDRYCAAHGDFLDETVASSTARSNSTWLITITSRRSSGRG
jgi:DNA mismatch repair protein MutS